MIFATALPALAQRQSDADDPFAGIEEMIVVGSPGAALLQTQEISVVGFDSDYLEAVGASDLSDISQFTPNLEIRTPFAASNPTLFIRGVGLRDFNANSSSSVAVYNDDIYMNSPAGQLAQLFDVENVDVLRGPQGGIYGRNASAGAIRVISRKPTGTQGGFVNFTYGRFDQIDVEAAAEGVLVPEVLSMRVAGKMSLRDGTTRNRCADPAFANPVPGASATTNFTQAVHAGCFNPAALAPPQFGGGGAQVGTPLAVKEFVNDVNNWAMRSITRLQLDVADGLDVLVNFHGGQNRGDARQFQVVGASQRNRDIEPVIERSIDQTDQSGYRDPDNFFGVGPGKLIRSPFDGDPFEGDFNNVEREKLDLFGTSIVAELVSGSWTTKAIVGYEWNQRDTTINLDGNPFAALEPNLNNEAWQITGELRTAWDGGEGFSFQLAGMFLYEALDVDNNFVLARLTDERVQQFSFFTRYGAAYGDATWEISEWLSLHAAGRLNVENKEISLLGRSESIFRPDAITFTDKSEATEIGFAGDVTLSYLPTEDVTFYVKYARGWKGPHINGGIVSQTPAQGGGSLTDPVDPEVVDSVELGIKSLWWGSRLRLNGAAFFYDYQDLQVFRLRNAAGGIPVNELINAQDANILGIELDIDVRPFEGIGPPILEGFNVFASFAWLDTSYTEFLNVNQSVRNLGDTSLIVNTTIDFSGKQLVNAPEFAFVGFAQWILPTEWGTLVPRFDWSFKDDVFFSPENSDLVGQSALWLMNLRLVYKAPSENLEISGWVENLTDQSYTLDVFNLARFRQSIAYAIGDPRTYGLTVKVSF